MFNNQHLKTLVIRLALVIALATASAGVMSAIAPAGQAMACNASGHGGGGC